MPLTILHTNDFHGRLTPEKAALIRALKEQAEPPCLYLDSGDCIKAGNLAIPTHSEEAWPLLTQAGCDASTLGNRESHISERAFLAKTKGAAHPLLAANMRRRDGSRPVGSTKIFETGGMKVGIVGVMVPMVTERMITAAASAFLWDLPIPTALNLGSELRDQVDCLIALTHIGISEDRLLAQHELFDIILGGHSHTLLEQPEKIGRTYVCQGGCFGHHIGRYVWENGLGIVESEIIPLP